MVSVPSPQLPPAVQPVPEQEKIQEADYQAALKRISQIDPQAATMIDEAIMVLHEHFQERRAVEWTRIVLKAGKDQRYITALVTYARHVFDEFGIAWKVEQEHEAEEEQEDEEFEEEEQQPALLDALLAIAPSLPVVSPVTAPSQAGVGQLQAYTQPVAKPTRYNPWIATNTPTAEVSKALGVAAIAFGLILWIPGSRYALDGWTLALNVVFNDVASLGFTIPYATGLWSLLFIAVGLIYSIAEQKVAPIQLVIVPHERRRRLHFLGWPLFFAWCAVHLSDVGATWIGVAYVETNTWPIAHWVAAHLWASITWSVVLTYLPEVLMMAGWRWLGLPWPLWKLWSE